jgi:hypothetical protein
MRTSSARIVILALALSLPSGLLAQSGQGDLAGFVRLSGRDNDAVRVTVKITRLSSPPQRHVMTSDSGDIYHRYAFKRIRMGEYRIRISAPGYVPYDTILLLGSDMHGVLAVCLRHKGEVPNRSSPTMCGPG